MAKTLKITCEGADTADYKKIENFQGDLKTMDEDALVSLRAQFEEHGFNSPIHVWKKGTRLYNLDGHQRIVPRRIWFPNRDVWYVVLDQPLLDTFEGFLIGHSQDDGVGA